jgi:hypothetical protein
VDCRAISYATLGQEFGKDILQLGDHQQLFERLLSDLAVFRW